MPDTCLLYAVFGKLVVFGNYPLFYFISYIGMNGMYDVAKSPLVVTPAGHSDKQSVIALHKPYVMYSNRIINSHGNYCTESAVVYYFSYSDVADSHALIILLS